jgi:hypothetical protein
MAHPLEVIDDDGRPHVFPSVRSRIRVIESAPTGLANPFPAIFLGKTITGVFGSVVEAGSFAEAKEAFNPEDAPDVSTDALAYAFKPSPDPDTAGAPFCRCVRVGTPTVAYVDLLDSGPAAAIRVTSIEKGLLFNELRALVTNVDDNDLTLGRDVSIGFRPPAANVKTGRKLGPVMKVQYTAGADTATLTITAATPGQATRLQTALVNGAAGTVALDIDLTRPEYATCKQVLDFINSQTGYRATFQTTDAPLDTLSSRELDAVNAGNIDGVDLLVSAKIGAICAWINTYCKRIGPVRGVTAARTAGATNYPAETAVWQPFANGTNPAAVLADYVAALAVLVATPVKSGILFLDTQDVSVQGAVLDWMDAQYATYGRHFRAVFGHDATVGDGPLQARAASIGRHNVALFGQRIIDPVDPTKVHNPLIVAAAFAGMTAGMQAELNCQDLVLTDRLLRAADIHPSDKREIREGENNARGGVSMLTYDDGVRIALALTTAQSPKRAYRMWSEAVAIEMLAYNVEAGSYRIRIAWATPQWLKAVRRRTEKVLQAAEKAGIITPGLDLETGAALPAYQINTVAMSLGRAVPDFNASLAGENDHIQIRGTILKVALQA